MRRYDTEFPDADVVLFEPSTGDPDMFFTNVFSYAERERLSEHAYQRTRAQLLRRYDELAPIFSRHGILIRRSVLTDSQRTLRDGSGGAGGAHRSRLMGTAAQLGRTLRRLEDILQSSEVGKTAAEASQPAD
jgi:hypothetical protein